MKVMTEERFKELIGLDEAGDYVACINDILEEFQELDQLTVTRLRPMSELVDSDEVDVLAFNSRLGRFIHFAYQNHMDDWWVYEFDYSFKLLGDYDFEGWIPMPKYEPEQS